MFRSEAYYKYYSDLVKYNNKFYIYFPANETNYVVWADSINGPWSDPIDLKIGNIDPGHFTDEKGNPLPFVSVFEENTYRGTTSNEQGKYQLQVKDVGKNKIVFQFISIW